jgi:hypothetical protein
MFLECVFYYLSPFLRAKPILFVTFSVQPPVAMRAMQIAYVYDICRTVHERFTMKVLYPYNLVEDAKVKGRFPY